jgi:hypothetical protein
MGFLRWLGWVASAPIAELADSEPSAIFSVELATPVDDYIQAQQVDSSLEAPVTREKALTVDAVIRGRNLLCSFAALPLVTRDARGKVIESKLLNQIDPNMANVITIAGTVDDLIFEGYAWWRCTAWDSSGFPISAEKLDARTVTMTPPSDHAKGLRTLPSEQKLPVGTVWVEGVPTPIRDGNRPIMIRFDSPNPGLLKSGARSIRRLLLLESAGARYADNPRPQDYFTPEDGADSLSDPEIEEVLTAWKLARKKRSTAYVPAAMKYNTVDVPTPVELQIIEQQRKAEIGIANRMGLDPEDLGISTTTRTYQNGVDRRQDRVNDVYSPYMEAITQRLGMNDVSRRGHTVGFELNNYLKPDPATRWANHKIAVEIGAMDIAEVRDVEGLDPNPELERKAKQKAAQPVVTAPDELAQRRTSAAASRPAGAAFSKQDDADEHVSLTFAVDDDTRAEFSTDLEARTITGLMLPWNKASRDSRSYSLWRFKKDSLNWTEPSRVKLNLDHKRTDAVAYAQKIWSTPKGLMATFKVTRAAVGDEALILAEDKVKDGFSVEVDFPGGAASWALVEDGDDLVRDVHNGQLTGCALTAAPSFDDARLTSVRASRDREDGPMQPEDNKSGGVGTLNLSTEASAAFAQVVSTALTEQGEKNAEQLAAFTDAVQALVDAQQTPGVVNPPGTARFEVNEAPTYRFDGSRGEFDFSTDIIAGAKNNDAEAMARVQNFMKNEFAKARAEFAVTTSNVASLNPNINRPDMYVDQLQYPTPLWNAIRKGTISDNTPFVLPKFNTSSGLVADHVQGTEPTPGALTTTSQTITPSAVSGKVEVTREAWDQGGNPQLSTILWRQMVRAYDEALEQGAAALFAGVTPGGTVTLTAGGADAALAAEVKAALAALHFIRGGFRFQDFVLESGLYRALAEAVDDTGRPLFPVIGAQNADGQMGNLFGSLSLAGLAGRPAWALAYTAAAPNKSYLFNREDVHGWASAPQRLDFEYRVAFVDVAIWGYKAFACTRTDGVRAFVYDETP